MAIERGRPTPSPGHNACHNDSARTVAALPGSLSEPQSARHRGPMSAAAVRKALCFIEIMDFSTRYISFCGRDVAQNTVVVFSFFMK